MNCKQSWEKYSHLSNAFKNVSIGLAVIALTVGAFFGYQQVNLHLQDVPDVVAPAETVKFVPVTEQDIPELCGWAGPEVAQQEWIAGQYDKRIFDLAIKGAGDNSKRRVVLWDAAKWVNGGKHLLTFRQLIGDCVGAGATHAVNYLQTVAIVFDGRIEEFKPVYLPYHYACGRNAQECGGGRIRGPSGSIGSWQAEALKLYGVIPADLEGLQPYSRDVVSSWAVRMPESKWIEKGKLHIVKDVAHITSVEQAIDALCNGYPLTIASDWGGMMSPPTVDGRLVNRRTTTWMHQMCVIGYDGETVPGKQYFYVLNSWGPDAHGVPTDDAPPGGFWILRSDLEYIILQGDTFALSDLQGFPARNIDLTPLGKWWHNERENDENPNVFVVGRNHRVDYQPSGGGTFEVGSVGIVYGDSAGHLHRDLVRVRCAQCGCGSVCVERCGRGCDCLQAGSVADGLPLLRTNGRMDQGEGQDGQTSRIGRQGVQGVPPGLYALPNDESRVHVGEGIRQGQIIYSLAP